MSEKIKYIVKCTFCDKDYTVEIEDGEDFSCPTCGGAGSREHASRVKGALEIAEIEELRAELKRHKQKALFSKKRSIEDIAGDEELLNDFRFDQIDKWEASMERDVVVKRESPVGVNDNTVETVEEPLIPADKKAGIRLLLILAALLGVCAVLSSFGL